ncbi:MAG: alpha/beta fold hydrolase [Burkholderiales bacterium]
MHRALETPPRLVRRIKAAFDPTIERLEARARIVETPVSGGSIVWRSWGEGPPILLLHGGVGSWLHWIANIEDVARDHRVVAVDLPGLGDSKEVPKPHTADAIAGFLRDDIDTVFPEATPIAIAGFSLGGAVSLPLAAMLGPRAGRLVLCGPSGMGAMWQNTPARPVRRRPDMTEAELLARAREALALTLIADPARIDDRAAAVQRTLLDQDRRLRGDVISYTEVVLDTLPKLHASTRAAMIIGERDVYVHPDARTVLDVVARRFPRVATCLVPGAGHWVQYEGASIVNAILRDDAQGRAA